MLQSILAAFVGLLFTAMASAVYLLAQPNRAKGETTISCPPGMYDMLDWMTMDSDLRSTYYLEGTSNPIYTIMEPDLLTSMIKARPLFRMSSAQAVHSSQTSGAGIFVLHERIAVAGDHSKEHPCVRVKIDFFPELPGTSCEVHLIDVCGIR